jgi:intein/homing endonuclease
VTGRFVTRDVANVVKITLANGTEIRATDVHPVWSVDREDWVPAGSVTSPASSRALRRCTRSCQGRRPR